MRKIGVLLILVVAVTGLLMFAACEGPEGVDGPQGSQGAQGATGPEGPQGVVGPTGTAGCSTCHNDGTALLAKQLQYANSVHASASTLGYAGGRDNCTSCHSSEGFTAWQAAGGPTSDTVAAENTTPINCRTCHDIHTTYTTDDFALTTTAPVTLMVSGETFDLGPGNLCASCHQPRTGAPEAGVGTFDITSTHYGPHRGPQSTILMGIGGYGGDDAERGVHYVAAEDSGCSTCHMGDGSGTDTGGHTLTPTLAGCQTCHDGLDTFDRHDVQTDVQALLDELEELLEGVGILHDGHPVVGTYTEAQAGALYNYLLVIEDKSLGVHNSHYTKEILETAIEALQ